MSDRPLVQWARYLASEIGGKMKVRGADVYLEPVFPEWKKVVGDRGAFLLHETPQDRESWRDRLQYVEKAAAQAVLTGPVGFSCTLENPGEPGETVEILRLAFGFSLSAGSSCRARYTAYYLYNRDMVFYIRGADKLFETSQDIQLLNLKQKKLITGLENLFWLAGQIEEDYTADALVQQQFKKLRDSLTAELRDLERFYSPGQDLYIQVHGNPPQGIRGEDLVEAEQSKRLEDIVEKHKISVLFEPLSVGCLRCTAKLTQRGAALEVSLPFVDQPISPIPKS